VSSSAEVIFHQLCTRVNVFCGRNNYTDSHFMLDLWQCLWSPLRKWVFRSRHSDHCNSLSSDKQIQRAYTDEFDTDVNDLPEDRFEELDSNGLTSSSKGPSPRTSPRKLLPSGRRQELVWKTPTGDAVSLHDISHQFQNFLNASLLSSEPALNRRRGRYAPRTAHRCPGYNRIEITLTANITRSAIVSHSSPIPHEICPVCKEVVKGTDVFNCICGSNGERIQRLWFSEH